jgi:cephalosporin-C deacetylase-like acetyl esterase
LAARVAGGVSLTLLTRVLFGYARLIRARYAKSPEVLAEIETFIARRTELDRQAAVHRLRLIADSDFCDIAKATKAPVFAITGWLDPVVPWMFVRQWLRRNCPTLREYKILWIGDHNVLSTAANKSADQVVQWMNSTPAKIRIT